MNKSGYVFTDLIQFYLSDVLAIPIVATLGLWFMRWLLNQEKLVLQTQQVVYIVALFSVVFELILPLFLKRYTADLIDIGMYVIGGWFFLRIMNK